MRLGALPQRYGIGTLINIGSGNLVDVTPEEAAEYWATGVVPGSVNIQEGWMTNNLSSSYQPAAPYMAPQGQYSAPGEQTLESVLQQLLQANESPFQTSLIAQGGDTALGTAGSFAAIAAQHCALHPMAPGCENPGPLAQQYAEMYLAWIATQPASAYNQGAAPVSLLTGELLPYEYTEWSGQYAGTPGYVSPTILQQPTGGGTGTAPTAWQQANTTPVSPTGAVAPLNALTGGTAPRTTTTTTAPRVTSTGAVVGGSPTEEVMGWLKDNWILVAGGFAALMILPSLLPGRR